MWNRRIAQIKFGVASGWAKSQCTTLTWARPIGGGAGVGSKATNGGNKKAEQKPRFFILKTKKT
jgi:hypothetical protein